MGYTSLFNKSEHFKESPGTIRVKEHCRQWASKAGDGVFATKGLALRKCEETKIQCIISNFTGWPKKPGTVDFLGLCSDQQLFLFTLLDRASFPHYNNTKIIKFG